jgi:hypothetical protein
MEKIEIEIKAIRVESDPSIVVYETIIHNKEKQATWHETWGSKELTEAFLKGVEAAFALTEVGLIKIPSIPEFPEYKTSTIEKIFK